MNIADRMRCIEIAAPGGPEMLRLSERPVPEPGNDEVLIKVEAAGVNRPDLLQRAGLYPPPPGASDLPGLEVAGTIVDTGPGAAREMVGTRVCALLTGGGYADYAVARADICLDVPPSLPMVEAAAIPETLFTVWHNLFERGLAADGDTVLVHGGTSGIGTMAISLCRLFGVRILVTCGSELKCDQARALGADVAINYGERDFVKVVRDVTEGRGANVILDMVGGDYVARNLACLADEGRHVSIAFQRGAKAEFAIPDLMRRRLTMTGSTLRPRSSHFKESLADELRRTVWPLVSSGALRPVIDSTFALADAAEAHRRMESGEHVGKVVLEMGGVEA